MPGETDHHYALIDIIPSCVVLAGWMSVYYGILRRIRVVREFLDEMEEVEEDEDEAHQREPMEEPARTAGGVLRRRDAPPS